MRWSFVTRRRYERDLTRAWTSTRSERDPASLARSDPELRLNPKDALIDFLKLQVSHGDAAQDRCVEYAIRLDRYAQHLPSCKTPFDGRPCECGFVR